MMHEYTSGLWVPLFDVYTPTALSQLAGYAKYSNRDFGNVYFRGENELHDNLRPSFARGRVNNDAAEKSRRSKFDSLVEELSKQEQILGLPQDSTPIATDSLVRAMLQHYGIPTPLVDVVDNLWVALWFGSYQYHSTTTDGIEYATYKPAAGENAMPNLRKSKNPPDSENQTYQYILLIAVPEEDGAIRAIDLRKSLPSHYLRPHAQHGLVLERPGDTYDFDFAEYVVAVLRIETLRALKWLGDGQLVSYENLFPSPMFDHGYSKLLNNERLSRYDKKIVRYVYSI